VAQVMERGRLVRIRILQIGKLLIRPIILRNYGAWALARFNHGIH